MSEWKDGLPPVGEIIRIKGTQTGSSGEGVIDYIDERHCVWHWVYRNGKTSQTVHARVSEMEFQLLKSEAERQSWPEMPDRFYEGLGWMHAECCAALDRGEDPRSFEVGAMVERCINDLTKTEAERKRDDLKRAILDHWNDKDEACPIKEWELAKTLQEKGYRKVNPLTDEHIDTCSEVINFKRGAIWARSQIMGED